MKFLSYKAYVFQLVLLFQSYTITSSLPILPDQNIHLSLLGSPLNYEKSWGDIFAEACCAPNQHLHMKVLTTKEEDILMTALGSTFNDPSTDELANIIVRFNHGNSYPSHITIMVQPFIMTSDPLIPPRYPTGVMLLLTHPAAGKHGTGVCALELVEAYTREMFF